MPTKRITLLGCLALLAACSPRAADSAADTAAPVAPVASAAAAIAPAVPASPAPADAPASQADEGDEGDQASGMPDLDQLNAARAAAGCEVPNDVGELRDIRIYCTMPADVRAFIVRENTCQHFAGEDAYDAARRVELEQASAEFCDGREARFDALYTQYFDDCATREGLIALGRRYDLFTDTAPDHCRPQDAG